MGMKNFDYKQFLLQKGERVGLIGALTLMGLLLVAGSMSGFSYDRPDTTADTLTKDAQGIRDKLQNGPGHPPEVTPFDRPGVDTTPISRTKFDFTQDPSIPWALENSKRQNPRLLEPKDGVAVFWKGVIQSPIIQNGNEPRIVILEHKEAPKNDKAKAIDDYQKKLRDQLIGIGRGPAGGPAAGPNFATRPGMPVAAGTDPSLAAGGKEEYTIKSIALKDLKDEKLARGIIPVRMAIVSAAFPYKQQLEEYTLALMRGKSVHDLAATPELFPEFLGINVRRRAIDPYGRVVKVPGSTDDFDILNLAVDYEPLVRRSKIIGPSPEDPNLAPVSFKFLVYPLLAPAHGTYPNMKLPLIEDSLRALAEKAGTNAQAAVPSPVVTTLTTGSIFETAGPETPGTDPRGRPTIRQFRPGDHTPPRPGETNPANPQHQELLVPDYCLIRFADVTLKPGYTYQYQIQVRAKNPNFGKTTEVVAFEELAKEPELKNAPWGPAKPIEVSVPAESFTYATEVDPEVRRAKGLNYEKDVTFVQMQRWLESVKLTDNGIPSAVGGWAMADVPVRRGELLGKTESVEIPMWITTRDAFDIPTLTTTIKTPGGLTRVSKEKGVPVNFSTEEVLADWEGGKLQMNRKGVSSNITEDAGYELLVVSPDGRLRVMNSKVDLAKEDRRERYKEWQQWVNDVRKTSTGGATSTDPFRRP
jgi:hypothetical protein